MPTVESNCALVSPHLSAIPMPCMISAESGPTMWHPTTLSVSTSTMSFMNAFSTRPASEIFMGVNVLVYTSQVKPAAMACSSVMPTVATGGCENTADAMFS